jgi:hypothetical protein
MAKAILIVGRNGLPLPTFARTLQALQYRLLPDQLAPGTTSFNQESRAAAVILNPNGATRLVGTSIWLGAAGEDIGWQEPGGPVPAGSYALFRTDPDRVELVADATASRTIWYTLTSDRFIASTSQRAIVMLLGNYDANPETVPWLLSSGTLGPEGGWDRRLTQVEPGERVVLDRTRWSLTRTSQAVTFLPDIKTPAAQQMQRLQELVFDSCCQMRFDRDRWIVPLSGGVETC